MIKIIQFWNFRHFVLFPDRPLSQTARFEYYRSANVLHKGFLGESLFPINSPFKPSAMSLMRYRSLLVVQSLLSPHWPSLQAIANQNMTYLRKLRRSPSFRSWCSSVHDRDTSESGRHESLKYGWKNSVFRLYLILILSQD